METTTIPICPYPWKRRRIGYGQRVLFIGKVERGRVNITLHGQAAPSYRANRSKPWTHGPLQDTVGAAKDWVEASILAS